MPATVSVASLETAFPRLDDEELCRIRELAEVYDAADGETVLRAGEADVDFFVVESGGLEVLNPSAGNRRIATHGPGEFSGDIDLLTRRPAIISLVAVGQTRLLRVAGTKLRDVLNHVPRLGEKLIVAFQVRRQLLADAGVCGLRVVGPSSCRDTTVVREFLYKNFVPFTWYDTETPEGKAEWRELGSPRRTPAIQLGDGRVLIEPSLRELGFSAGIWRGCPTETIDLAIVGGGPAGITAAVYAATEGLSAMVLDRLGPGGQAGGSSKIENFIGFPAGLSGMELATRGVLQMLKFGARMSAPVDVQTLEPPASPRDPYVLQLDCGARLKARCVLVATGVRWRKLAVPGADRFERAGIYYACTAVEAMLHENVDVVVVGGGNSAGQAAMYLAECCRNRRVHILVRSKLGTSMSDYLVARLRGTPNVNIREGAEVAEVHGGRRVEAVMLKGPGASSDGGNRLACGAIFVFIGAEPHADWLPDTVARDDHGYLLTGADALGTGRWPVADRDPCPLETTLPGVLAAGDVRAGSTKRVGFAVGDGALAVTCVHKLRSILGTNG